MARNKKETLPDGTHVQNRCNPLVEEGLWWTGIQGEKLPVKSIILG